MIIKSLGRRWAMLTDTIEYSEKAQPVKEDIEKQMSKVLDPEIGLDVVNLGLIYKVDLDEEGTCKVTLTYTSMGCTCATDINLGLERELPQVEGINEVDINVVWTPKWDLTRITRYGRIALGINPGRHQ